MANSYATKVRPSKPYPEFPLFAHNNGQWCRKIRGKLYAFGKWEYPTAAIKKHNAEYAFLKEGISPPDTFDGWRVEQLVNEFLGVQEDRLNQGEIEQITFDGLHRVGKLIVEYIPPNMAVEALRPEHFRELRNAFVKRFSPAPCRVNMSRVRSFFKFAYEEQLIDKPVFYGRGFKSPTKAMVRKARNQKPRKLFDPNQIKLLIDNASPALKAMILLSINTGMNNADLGNMQFRHVDLRTGWLDYPRNKTHVQRRAPLWRETVKAIREYLKVRQTPLVQFDEYVFVTKARRKWAHSSLPSEFRKLVEDVNTDKNGNARKKPPIPHGTFGYLRHTFETVGGGSRDQVAVNSIMGHVDDSMAAEYRESIDAERLEAVAKHVRAWLFGKRKSK